MAVDPEKLFLDAAVALFAAYRSDAKPTTIAEDLERALDDAATLRDALVPKGKK